VTPVAHIAGVPVEETLLALGGPAAIYATAVAGATALRRLGGRLRGSARRGVGAAE